MAENDECETRNEKLQAFKDYVHKRLDDAGIEKEPNGEHSKHGCRIGDRLDLVFRENEELKVALKRVQKMSEYKANHDEMLYAMQDINKMITKLLKP